MGLHFIGGERIQKGKGIGGLLRFASKLFYLYHELPKKQFNQIPAKKLLTLLRNKRLIVLLILRQTSFKEKISKKA